MEPHARLLPAGAGALAPSAALADAREAVRRACIDEDAEQHRRHILGFIDEHADALHRSCRTGHLTGSAMVVNPAGTRVVLLHHRKLGMWLQPGGHCDGDANLAAVALREATEETGLDGLAVHPVAVDVDVHRVEPPDEGPHLHLDVRFLVVAPDDTEPGGNHESTEIGWFGEADLDEMLTDASTGRLVRRGLDVHRALTGA